MSEYEDEDLDEDGNGDPRNWVLAGLAFVLLVVVLFSNYEPRIQRDEGEIYNDDFASYFGKWRSWEHCGQWDAWCKIRLTTKTPTRIDFKSNTYQEICWFSGDDEAIKIRWILSANEKTEWLPFHSQVRGIGMEFLETTDRAVVYFIRIPRHRNRTCADPYIKEIFEHLWWDVWLERKPTEPHRLPIFEVKGTENVGDYDAFAFYFAAWKPWGACIEWDTWCKITLNSKTPTRLDFGRFRQVVCWYSPEDASIKVRWILNDKEKTAWLPYESKPQGIGVEFIKTNKLAEVYVIRIPRRRRKMTCDSHYIREIWQHVGQRYKSLPRQRLPIFEVKRHLNNG